jgi:hypothetical protein
MENLCVTRALKVLKHLQRTVPAGIPPESLQGLSSLPVKTLARLHAVKDMHAVTDNAVLATFLANNPIPVARASVPDALFRGTLVFVRVTFNRSGQPPFAVSGADVQTALNYATLAVKPIQRYASQYGINSISVSPTILNATLNVTGNTFSDDQIQAIVNQVITDNHLSNAGVVILHDTSVANGPTNTIFNNKFGGYHLMTDSGHPYCFCKVFGTNLTIPDKGNVYAQILSHEIAEMVVDPKADLNNPEVADACAGNCNNDQFDLFDSTGNFIGGTNKLSTAPAFAFFINSIIQPEFFDPDTECAVKSANTTAVCIYPPPPLWNGPGTLSTVGDIVSIGGHFSTGDQRHLVVVGTKQGGIHEIFWKPGQVGIEGEDNLPVSLGFNNIVSVGSLYNSDQQRHVVIVGKKNGKVEEIFWKPETVGIEGHDELPVSFGANRIASVAGLYDFHQQRHVVLVGTTLGRVHEIFWKADTVGIEGTDALPVTFTPGSIVGVAVLYNTDDRRYVVVVGTRTGALHEIFWKADTAGVEGDDNLPISFGLNSIVAVAGFYDIARQRHVVVVATRDGKVHQVYWKALTVGIEAHSVVAQFGANSIAGLAAFYSASDQIEHIIVGLTNGRVLELFVKSDI